MATPEKISSASSADHEEGLEKLKQWGQWALMGIAVVFLGISLFQWNRSRGEGLKQEIFMAYSTAFTPEALAQVVEAYPDAPEAALARIQMGGMYFREGEYEEALAVYDAFLQAHPRHLLASEVRFSRWMTLEALGRLDEAMEGFASVSEENLMYPQALFGQARIHEKQGRADLALPLYRLIEESFEDSAWAFQAEMFRQVAELAARDVRVPEVDE
ncbi:MAG: tetratricopeptide repeat protein [Verrucomicrobia bacterium]|nr:tetratricopeptide repeat protein [Verrucomicrobiota bacterium]MCH8528198.1 tetratricopeptide repeat protein [Kiritimatiellia bacterium]